LAFRRYRIDHDSHLPIRRRNNIKPDPTAIAELIAICDRPARCDRHQDCRIDERTPQIDFRLVQDRSSYQIQSVCDRTGQRVNRSPVPNRSEVKRSSNSATLVCANVFSTPIFGRVSKTDKRVRLLLASSKSVQTRYRQYVRAFAAIVGRARAKWKC
jgi:hypothetical protein